MVARHNHVMDIFAAFCHHAHLSVKVEVGYGLGIGHVHSCPADVLVQGWDRGNQLPLMQQLHLFFPLPS